MNKRLMKESNMSIIAIARNKKRMTQNELAKEVGVSLSCIAMWERRERNIKSKYIDKLCEILDLTRENIIDNMKISYSWDIDIDNKNDIDTLLRMKKKYENYVKILDCAISQLQK